MIDFPRFDFVEQEVNKYWKKINKMNSKFSQRKDTTSRDKSTNDDKGTNQRSIFYASSGPKSTPIIDYRNKIFMMKNIINLTNQKEGHAEDSFDQYRKELESFSLRIDKIIPEILRLQFFQTKLSDNSDCLLKVCENNFRQYKEQKRKEQNKDHNNEAQFEKTGEVKKKIYISK